MTIRLRDSLKEEPQIKTSVFLPEDDLVSANRSHIPSSTAQTMQRTASGKLFILDSIACHPEDPPETPDISNPNIPIGSRFPPTI
jgi:hypothetical protein